MKINAKILSIPPYISTPWEHVSLLQLDNHANLVVHLKNGGIIVVPPLPEATLEAVFSAHREFLETPKGPDFSKLANFSIGLPGILPSLDQLGLTGIIQHDAAQKDAPDLPPELLTKIAEVAKTFHLDTNEAFQMVSEPHCNCPFCQIARKLADQSKKEAPDEIEISEKDLHFREWDIQQVGEKLYEVTNPLERKEHYQVFLGKPIGCTCGKNNCEHIVAVLNS